MSLRIQDTATEQELSKFLDKYFYPYKTQNFQRLNDFETQMKGIDVKCDFNSMKGLLIDEKAATHYINKNLPTFAFEIDFRAYSGNLIQGWLFDKSKMTTHYLLMWLNAKKSESITMSDITTTEAFLLSRTTLISHLKSIGITEESCKATSQKIRQFEQYGYFNKDETRPANFFYTSSLSEKPVNLVIRKSLLRDLSMAKFTITPTDNA